MTRDEVIKALKCCVLRDPDDRPRCGDCPYPTGSACSNRLKMDVLALLKEGQRTEMSMEKNEVIRGLEAVKETLEYECYLFGAMYINDAIALLKTEPKQGRWIFTRPTIGYVCSECGECVRNKSYTYCPNCGAKMEMEV